MKYLKICLWIILLSTTSLLHAVQIPQWFVATKSSDTSITLDWQDVEDVAWYYIYYGTKGQSWGTYEIEGVDLIESSDTVLSDLQPETLYYIAVTSIDKEWIESEYSQELQYKTQAKWEQKEDVNFRIVDVSVVDASTLEFIFSADVQTWVEASRTFVLEDLAMGTEIPIDISQVSDNSKNIEVLLWVNLTPNTEYKVTVLEIQDAQGNTIEAGIDAFITFRTPEKFISLDSAPEQDQQPIVVQPVQNTPVQEVEQEPKEESKEEPKDEQKELVPQQVITKIEQEPSPSETNEPEKSEIQTPSPTPSPASPPITTSKAPKSQIGVTIAKDELTQNKVTKAVSENKKLPQTGPELWLILGLLAFFLTGFFILSQRDKRS